MSARRIRFDIRQAGKPLLAVLVGLLVINVAFWLLAVRPKVNSYRDISADSQPRFERLKQREAQVRQLEGFAEALDKAEDDLQFLRTDVLATRAERLVDVMAELETICNQFNINLLTVKHENKILRAESLDRFGVIVPLEAGYADLRRFLQAIESSDKFLLVERVALAQNREGGVLLELNITMATYFHVPEELLRQAGRQKLMARKPTTRESVLLGVLAIALIAVLWISSGGGLGFGGGQPAPADDGPGGVAPVIDIAGLYPEPEPYDGQRDLFKYGPPPRAAAPPPRPKPPPVQRPKPPPPKPQPQRPPPKPKGPEPPRIAFKYVGYLGPKDSKIAVFEDGEELLLAGVGDVVLQEFKVVEFKYDSVVMGYTDDRFKDRTAEVIQEK